MIKKIKENKMITAAVAITLLVIVVTGVSMLLSQNTAEAKAVQENDRETENTLPSQVHYTADSICKDTEELDQELIKEICKDNGYDYDTVTVGDLGMKITDYGSAKYYLEKEKDRDLLYHAEKLKDEFVYDGVTDGYPLETSLNDIYCFNGAKAIIEKVCKEAGVNAENGKIGDLTTKQLVTIQEQCYETSDHKDS